MTDAALIAALARRLIPSLLFRPTARCCAISRDKDGSVFGAEGGPKDLMTDLNK